MRVTHLAVLAVASLASSAAMAADLGRLPVARPILAPQPVDFGGLYASLHGGALWVTDTNVAFVGGPTGTFGAATGWRVGGALGYDFNSMFGVEGEVSYGHVGVATLDGVALPSGSASLLTGMLNLVVGQQMGALRPYVGVGAGVANVSLKVDTGGGNGVNDNATTWGAQVFAGLDFSLTQNVSLGGRYRFQYIGATSYNDLDGDPITIDRITAHSVEAVLKVRLGR